jgi:1-acyl-sn-glycerol-3-phosphate acyltransferase
MVLFVLLGVTLTLLVSPPWKDGQPGALHKTLRQWWFKQACRIIGLRLRIIGKESPKPALWVANHISWLDIPLIGGSGNVGFLSKAEIRQWPVIGWLAKKSGTLFIDRGGKNASQKASEKISQRIVGGGNVLIFPEATTTDGQEVKRFHPRLFASAIDYGLNIQPVAIRYLDKKGQRHLKTPFIDHEAFIPNLLRIVGEPWIAAEVTFLPIIEPKGFSQRRQLAELAQKRINSVITRQEIGTQTDEPPNLSSK